MGDLSRELSITYGGYTVGGDQANRILEGIYTLSQDYERGEVGFTFVVKHTTEAAYAAEIAAAEEIFRKPRQNLTIQLGTQTLRAYSHSAGTGFNAFPRITKRQDDLSSGRARRYEIRIQFGLPANNVGTAFRRYSYVNVAYSPARQRTLTISGTWTAGNSASARANYESAFAAYVASVQTDLGGTWKRLEEPQTTADDQNKEINISCTFEEVVFTGIGAADADLRGERFTVTRSKFAPGDTPVDGKTVLRLASIVAVYEAWFDKDATTALDTKWATQRTKALSYMKTLFSGGAFALVAEHPDFDPVHNKITARLEAQGASATGIVEYTQTYTANMSPGVQLVPVASGKAFQKYLYQGPGSWVLTLSHTYEAVGGFNPPSLPEPGKVFFLGGMTPVLVREDSSRTPVRRGFDGYEMTGQRASETKQYELYEPIVNNDVATPPGGEAGAGGGGSGSTPTEGGGDAPTGNVGGAYAEPSGAGKGSGPE